MKRFIAIIAVVVSALSALPARAQEPLVSLVVGPRHGHATPSRCGCAKTAAGNIIVAQPTPDVLVITMTGVAVATGHPFKDSSAAFHFNVDQELSVKFHEPAKLAGAKLYMEGQVIGLLRSQGCCKPGSASHGEACAALTCSGSPVVSMCVPTHGVCCGENLSINCQEGPVCVPIVPGCYHLNAVFGIGATHEKTVCCTKPASAEFAPDAIDPNWLPHFEPFRGALKADFGFRVVIRIVPELLPEPAPDAKDEAAEMK